MEIADESPFIPLSVFLHMIKDDHSIDFNFIKNTTEKAIEHKFQISFSNPPLASKEHLMEE